MGDCSLQEITSLLYLALMESVRGSSRNTFRFCQQVLQSGLFSLVTGLAGGLLRECSGKGDITTEKQVELKLLL